MQNRIYNFLSVYDHIAGIFCGAKFSQNHKLLNLHHVDPRAISDEDMFRITIMQNPDSRAAELLYNMFLKRSSCLYC